MLYLKTQAGPGKWDLFPADRVRWDTTYLEVPRATIEKGDVDFREFLKQKEIHEAALVSHLIVCVPFLWTAHDEGPHDQFDDCVRWAVRTLDGEEHFHVFQGDAYLLGVNGQTIERI